MKIDRFVLDPIFCRKFVGVFTRGGKRNRAFRLLRSVIYRFRKEKRGRGGGRDIIFELALRNITPRISVRPRKKGSITYKIPYPLRKNEGLAYAVRWLAKAASARRERTLSVRICAELRDASEGRGKAFQRCLEFHSVALSNRGFIKFLR